MRMTCNMRAGFLAALSICFTSIGLAAPPSTTYSGDVAMDSISGSHVFPGDLNAEIYTVKYPQVRHVSLTVSTEGIDSSDAVGIYARHAGKPSFFLLATINEFTPNNLVIEFDALEWEIYGINVASAQPLYVDYDGTVTYPSR